ncbi:MAG TPA: aminomethyl-transferring glycine dehydrogenase [Geminicoccus sp.]|jgi:glycine dehydrogenase|uniref:aminomethyl-transferring glycine dehydrogenase n=1 Tax=Geminicoccus sp. TaxID=2024832 RepID=UPI002E30FC35|nr:aminomethyl-transferring glycine dehydrogenase [Geminicoccus sp.]HEX2528488.1 aminomethyl-transferring glycine dehydrogenase [Geminicoccus sp.]
MHHPDVSLSSLEDHGAFRRRHIGPDAAEQAAMLETLGLTSLDELIEETIPGSILSKEPLALKPAADEHEALAELRAYAARNIVTTSLIGTGYYGTRTPNVILRNVLENPGWYTAYTPYQAEVSQGRLEAVLIFQQVVQDLTGMEIANASLLDEATAAAEAMAMALRVTKSKSRRFFIDNDTHPQTVAVLRTRAEPLGVEVVLGDAAGELPAELFGALFSYPGSSGQVRDLRKPIETVRARSGLAIVASDLLALAMLKPPGEMGADVVVGSSQRFGVPMGFGGPHAAFFATKDVHKRTMPGRLIGVSRDAQGGTALRMALQTREQHIRREKATSNICTAQVLLAVMAAFYAVYHGPDGIRRIAARVHRLTRILARGLAAVGVTVETTAFFDTLTLHVPGQAAAILKTAHDRGIDLRPLDADHLGLSLDETSSRATVEAVLALFGDRVLSVAELDEGLPGVLPLPLQRQSAYLQHPTFSLYRSETEMLRYLRHLQSKDVALDRSMIPLGSCTMKLNATAEMIPVTWPEFGQIHPFAPADRWPGYRMLLDDLENWLASITGFDAVSLQPNAGSQGEYAGLLAIRGYHRARGDTARDVCLIPSSAHGTNPASAAMAGMKIVVVACDPQGNVDVGDLKAKIAANEGRIAALMITYPSTHGVFEETIREICRLVHEAGGQVYMDGANLNAMVGLCRPGEIGADVSHMNLHKTFCIPHGGGGPGMGPIGVGAHLAPYLPGHPLMKDVNPAAADGEPDHTVSAAPWGSASILPISWMYIRMMGADGLAEATKVAILNANYIANRLHPHFPVLYRGSKGRVAHECIIDLRPLKEASGITPEDVAKRLVDYGFHAPTMSFPVVDTLMIEPTESESRREIDRFCDAMIAIRHEIAKVEAGVWPLDDNPVRNAPHVPDELLGRPWSHPYDEATAFHPARHPLWDDKYWPPVARVDNVFGDRNLVCSCPPMEAWNEAAE